MVRWLDDDDESTYDTVHSNAVVAPSGSDVLSLTIGTKCIALFEGQYFDVEITASGTN